MQLLEVVVISDGGSVVKVLCWEMTDLWKCFCRFQ